MFSVYFLLDIGTVAGYTLPNISKGALPMIAYRLTAKTDVLTDTTTMTGYTFASAHPRAGEE